MARPSLLETDLFDKEGDVLKRTGFHEMTQPPEGFIENLGKIVTQQEGVLNG